MSCPHSSLPAPPPLSHSPQCSENHLFILPPCFKSFNVFPVLLLTDHILALGSGPYLCPVTWPLASATWCHKDLCFLLPRYSQPVLSPLPRMSYSAPFAWETTYHSRLGVIFWRKPSLGFHSPVLYPRSENPAYFPHVTYHSL